MGFRGQNLILQAGKGVSSDTPVQDIDADNLSISMQNIEQVRTLFQEVLADGSEGID